MNQFKHIYIVGDIHGDTHFLLQQIKNSPEGSLFIQVGDFGVGLPQTKSLSAFKPLNDVLVAKKSFLFAIRGNHDERLFFDNEASLTNLFLLKDYTVKEINGLKWRFVGGATSIDRYLRTKDRNWWTDEGVDYNPDLILDEADVLITHCCGTDNVPVDSDEDLKKAIARYCPEVEHWREQLRLDILKGRKILDRIIFKTKPKYHYYGHHHFSHSSYKNGVYTRLLNINEIEEFAEGVAYSHYLET